MSNFSLLFHALKSVVFLNQAHTRLWLACAWFRTIISVQTSVFVYVCLCVSALEAIYN